MLVGLKSTVLAEEEEGEYSHLREVVERAGLENLTALMASVS